MGRVWSIKIYVVDKAPNEKFSMFLYIIGSNNQQSCTFQGFERKLSSRHNSMSSTTL
jgi:hypothetical protein